MSNITDATKKPAKKVVKGTGGKGGEKKVMPDVKIPKVDPDKGRKGK